MKVSASESDNTRRLIIGINMSTAREKGELEKRAEMERSVLGTLED
jgi:hypothetical protein